jgi:hypothetical protein
VEKYCTAGQTADDTMAHAHCMMHIKATNIETENVIFIVFPLQQWLHERTSMLRLYAHCLSCSITAQKPIVGHGFLIIEVSRSRLIKTHTQSVGILWTSDQPDADASTPMTVKTFKYESPCIYEVSENQQLR